MNVVYIPDVCRARGQAVMSPFCVSILTSAVAPRAASVYPMDKGQGDRTVIDTGLRWTETDVGSN